MASSADFLTRQRDQITRRLDELRPLYEEYLTLERAQEALEQVGAPVRRAVRGRRGPGRPPGSTRTRRGRATRRRTTRRRSGGTRADDALKAIRANPGITIPALADKLKIRPNYLYRVTAQLQKERKIKKRGREFHPA